MYNHFTLIINNIN